MAEFRRLLDQPGYSTSHPRDDEIVLEQVAWAIHLGRLRMEWGDVREQQPSGGAYQEPDQQQPASSSTPPAPRPSHSATPSGPVLEEPTFPANLDALAIAQSQKEAARLGLPFCEECARMAAANARS